MSHEKVTGNNSIIEQIQKKVVKIIQLRNYETTRFPERSAGKRSHLKDVLPMPG